MEATVVAESVIANAPTIAPDDLVRPEGRADFSANARTVLAKRYLVKDDNAQPIETPEECFWRVASTIACEDSRYGASRHDVQRLAERFYDLMVSRRWEPNSPTIMNAGRPLGQLSACFVLPVEDELRNGKDGIYDTLSNMAAVHQSGGGTGFSFSRIRPQGDPVRSTTGVASGPVSFMSLYDASTDVVKQGGTRRGANMGILRVDHPDIMDFVGCKQDTSKITNFNISVAITDAFMRAVREDRDYDLIHPRDGRVTGTLRAREVFDTVVRNAWRTGEPGVFFVDRANHYNPVPHMGAYEATNPCGEQNLLPFDVCNLGSLNLGMYVDEDVDTALPWRARINWRKMRDDIDLSVRFLDNVIDANRYPLYEIRDLAERIRRIGNGVMGFADLLVRLGVPYDSDEGIEVASGVAAFFHEQCLSASEGLAEVRGVFPEWARSIWGPDVSCARDAKGERIRPERRLRNCNVNTVAPTGTISIFAGCSGGIEPLFAVAFMRNQAGSLMPDVNEDFLSLAREQGWHSDALMERIAEGGHIHFDEVPEAVQRVFATSHTISPEYHVRMQAAWQGHVDSSISKTTNFANDASEDDVRAIYELAFDLGCKGVTVYRDGSRDFQVLSSGKGTVTSTGEGANTSDEVARLKERVRSLEGDLDAVRREERRPRKRPQRLIGETRAVQSPLGKVFVTINHDEDKLPFEVFATLGKAGGSAMADVEAIARLASLALRSGLPVDEVHRQLRGISSDRAYGFGENKVLSVPDAIAIAIEQYVHERAGVQQELLPEEASDGASVRPVALEAYDGGESAFGVCPECQASLEFSEGCMKCRACAHSECS